ncbi:OLC1v1019247C1 [Oldenlandia corymbosa var. corymbosa]|uniref:OLC1v1019247C1 n=1 Tax=Oldenlandia corymbosa var. corymbosa TaxID=529605 RepID=A0AAV1EDI1_OLDCO|nr:OLC1v1019247C1 [Oldenlandia corymbosa var. corymbosa]
MDRRNPFLAITLTLCLFSLQALINVEAASVVFLDSPTHKYLRSPSEPAAIAQTDSMSLSEVGAAVSVLLGFAPPSTLSASSSSKLNKVLIPNPFDRPLAVFALEVTGVEDSQLLRDTVFGGALKSKVMSEESKADIQVPDEDEVSVISLNDLPSFDSDKLSSNKELHELASFLGGSYVSGHSPLSGELSIPLPGGDNLRLDLSKKAELELLNGIVGLLRKIERAMVMLEDLSPNANGQKLSELITGTFDGIKALRENHGTEGAEEGVHLFAVSVPKIFDYLQARYRGKIVGVIVHGEADDSESKKLLNMVVNSRTSPRWLEEESASLNATSVAEALLVRRTIAWTTGILLIIATLLGVSFTTLLLFISPLLIIH